MLVFVSFQAQAGDGRNLGVTTSGASNRFALVIGNDIYKHVDPLEKAANDARAMGRALELAHFQTKVVVNASRTQMNTAINRFVNDVKGGGVGVFFFAGHGVQVNNQNFLIPVDLQDIQSEADIADQGVSLQGLQDKLAEARVKFSLLVVDACRNNPLPKMAGRSLGGTRGLTQASSAEGQIVVFSAGANQHALDKLSSSDHNPNGVFTREFLPLLTKPGVTIRDAVLQVRSSVRARAKSVDHEQFPAIYDQAEGDFYFIEGSATQVASLVPVAAPTQPLAHIKNRDEIEQDTWEAVQGSNNATAVQEYLKQYPKGRFVGQARVLIAALKGNASRHADPVTSVAANTGRSGNESSLWDEVKSSSNREDFDVYLAEYPKGKYIALARSRVAKLQESAAAEAVRKEQESWRSAETSGSEVGYQTYLTAYPLGKFSALVAARIVKLKKDVTRNQQKPEAEPRKQNEEAHQVVTARPKIPLEISEDIWRTIEASEAYRNLPRSRAINVSHIKEYRQGRPWHTATQWQIYTSNKKNIPLSEKCGEISNSTTTEKINVLETTTDSDMRTYSCGNLFSLGFTAYGKSAIVIQKVDDLKGSLFPMRIGAKLSHTVQYKNVTSDTTSTVTSACEVMNKTSASQLNPQLAGTAWMVQCLETSFGGAATEKNDYYLEDVGVMLSDIADVGPPSHSNGGVTYFLPIPVSKTEEINKQGYLDTVTNSFKWKVSH